MPRPQYKDLLARLLQMSPKRHKDLSRMQQSLTALGNPHKNLRTVHVTGSNGKGSVCWKIASALQDSGLRVGMFTSPHISSFRERIRVDFEPIPQEDMTDLLDKVFQTTESANILSQLSFFDTAVLVGMLYFQQKEVDLVVLEVGIGGRLDSTNIVDPPEVAAITSAALEHTDILGDTLQKIIREKSGIVKQGVPVVIGSSVPVEVVAERAKEMEAPLIVCPQTDDYKEDLNQVVTRVLRELMFKPGFEKLLKRAGEGKLLDISDIGPPCRFDVTRREDIKANMAWEFIQQNPPCAVVFDVGHNPAAITAFFSRLKSEFPGKKVFAMVNISKSKDIDGCVDIVLQNVDEVYCLPINHMRLSSVGTLKEQFEAGRKRLGESCSVPIHDHGEANGEGGENKSLRSQFESVLPKAVEVDAVVAVFGSFFIMSDVRVLMGIGEVLDPVITPR